MYSSHSNQQISAIYKKNIWIELSIYLSLCLIGWISIFSIEYNTKTFKLTNIILGFSEYNYSRQFFWILISSCLGMFIIFTNSKFFASISYYAYVIGIILMILTIFIGTNFRGSHSWIIIGSTRIQVAQFMIIFVNLALSKYISNNDIKGNPKHQLIALAIVFLPTILSVYQSETGLALVFLSLILVLYREGISILYLFFIFYIVFLIVVSFSISFINFNIGLGILTIIIVLIYRKNIIKHKALILLIFILMGLTSFMQHIGMPVLINKTLAPYQIRRLRNTFGISDYDNTMELKKGLLAKKKKNVNYNVTQSIVAIGSGGFVGKGFLNNTQTRLDFVPEQSTDFIICSFAESFGFLGIIVLLGIYIFYIFRTINIAEKQRNIYSRSCLYGIISMISFHLIINIGMTIGIIPVIGIPLPLISYGGGAMLSFSLLYFISIRLDIDRQIVIK